jgi:hypothetical protein
VLAEDKPGYTIPIEGPAWTTEAQNGSVQQHFINHPAELLLDHCRLED